MCRRSRRPERFQKQKGPFGVVEAEHTLANLPQRKATFCAPKKSDSARVNEQLTPAAWVGRTHVVRRLRARPGPRRGGNILLVLGASMLAGGLRHAEQHFNPSGARSQATMLTLAAIALFLPAAYSALIVAPVANGLRALSVSISIVLLAVYALFLSRSNDVTWR
jgi:hypothetical protein